MDIVRIEKVNLVDAVYTQLRELLISGKWPEGTKIPSENELCREFSVSRVVIREALQKLRGEKLIVTRQGVGTYAANPSNFSPTDQEFVLSEQTYRDFLLFREGVEINAIRLTRKTATEEDYGTEYLAKIISAKIVDSLDEAIAHINKYSTGHSEAILTKDYASAQRFLREIDSACVYVNASTRFTDGFEFGFGAEIGISTQKLHARGPMGLLALTSTKYIIYGDGQTRP